MCDCYEHKCETCTNTVSLHIADFCVPRSAVHVYCPECIEVACSPDAHYPQGNYYGLPAKRVFIDMVSGRAQIRDDADEPIGKKGQVVLIICDEPRAYGIHLN